MAGSPRNSLGNVRSDMDITYPEHLSRLHRHSLLSEFSKPHFNPKKNTRSRRANRYRTQPVTFDEIQEVDEDSMIIDNQGSNQGQPKSPSLSASKLEKDFYRFTKALEAKCKKPATSDGTDNASKNKDAVGKSNGIQDNHKTAEDPLRWTDYTREGSI